MNEDNRLEVEIEADERPATSAMDRLQAKVQQTKEVLVEMGRKAGSALGSLTREMVAAAQVSGGLYLRSVVSTTVALRAHYGAMDMVVTGYRAARLWISPTMFTAASIGVIAFTEHLLKAAWAEGKLAEAQAMQSARTKLQIREIQELTLAGRASGRGEDFFLGAVSALKSNWDSKASKAVISEFDIDRSAPWSHVLRDIGVAFDDIKDPVERARKAVALFGDGAEKYLPALNARLDDSIARFQRMGAVLGTETAKEFAQFKRDVEEVTAGLEELLGVSGRGIRVGALGGLGPAGAGYGVMQAAQDPATKNAFAIAGKELGQIFLTAFLIPFFGSPSTKMTAEEREARRRQGWSDADWAAEARSLMKPPTAEGFLETQIKSLEARRATLGKYRNPDDAVRARMAELDQQLTKLRAQQNPLNALFGDASREYVEKWGRSLDGLNARLGVLKQRREQILTAMPYANADQRALLSRMLPGLNQEIQSVEGGIAGYEIRKAQREGARSTWSALQETRARALGGLGGIVAETERQGTRLSSDVDARGNVRHFALLKETRENLEKDLHLRIREEQKKTIAETQKADRDRYEQRLAYETKLYQQRLENEVRWEEKLAQHEYAVTEFQVTREGFARDAQLRALEATDAQTLEQKVALERRKADIEIEYLEKVHEIKMRLFDMDTSRMVKEEEWRLKSLGYQAEEIKARIGEVAQQREDIRQQQGEMQDEAVTAAREKAQGRELQTTRDHYRQMFNTLKQEAGGVIDAMFTRSTNIFAAMGNSLKAAILTAIKDVMSSRIAAMLMQVFTGQRVSFAQGSGFLGALGLGSAPVFGAGGGLQTAAMGGGGGVSTAPGILGLMQDGNGRVGLMSMASGSGWKAGLQNAAPALGALGGISLASASFGLAGAGHSPLVRAAGFAGTFAGATLAGGAIGTMIAPGLGTIIGLGVGAAVGLVAGLIGFFRKSAVEKAREKIESLYKIRIEDKGVLQQIVGIATSAFGGNLDLAIRSPQVEEMVRLYGMITNQPGMAAANVMRPATMYQAGGSLYNVPNYVNGTPLPMVIPPAAPASGDTYVQLDRETTWEFLEARQVRVIERSPRAVASANLQATRQNYARRENAALALSPGSLTA